MKLLKNYSKLKAFSLAESVVATVIISSCVLIATMVFINTFQRSYSTPFLEGTQKVYRIIEQLKEEVQLEDEEYNFETYKISQKVNLYNEAPQIKHVQLILTTQTRSKTFNYLIKENEVVLQ